MAFEVFVVVVLCISTAPHVLVLFFSLHYIYLTAAVTFQLKGELRSI